MITFEGRGDIFDRPTQTITCPINAAGAMGKGLALEFRHRVPGLYDYYLRRYPKYAEMVGPESQTKSELLEIFKVPDGRQVLLFPTKSHWKQPSTLYLLETNLRSLAARYEQLNIQSLSLPAIGCGLGELDYQSQVRELIYRHLDSIPLPVEIVLFP